MELLLLLLIVLAASRLAGELIERTGQPALLGELLAGTGLAVLATSFGDGFFDLDSFLEHAGFKSVTDLGLFFLMFLAGLEMEPEGLLRASGAGLIVALGGIVLPLALGLSIGFVFLPASDLQFVQALFLGIALSITAVAVSTKVLMDLNYLESRVGRVIVSAAVIDDILAMIFLAVLTSIAKSGEVPSMVSLSLLALKVCLFFVGAFLLGRYVFRHLRTALNPLVSDEITFTAAVVIALVFAVVSDWLSMHFIIGAFVGGLLIHAGAIGEVRFQRILTRTSGITLGFLAPVFFASIGMRINLSALLMAPVFCLVVILAAVLGKLLGCGLAAGAMRFRLPESLAIGIAMNGRGAVELVLAAIAVEYGVFTRPTPVPPVVASLYSSVVLMAFITTLITPMGLKWVLKGSATNA